MPYEIAGLITEVPEARGLSPRLGDYRSEAKANPDVVICEDGYRWHLYPENISDEMVAYLESGFQFCRELLRFNGFYLHASAVALEGSAYLFSGPCGMGKSTHTQLWQQVFGEKAKVFNDDKPALRRLGNRWYAYGTPWCGKDGININMKVPLAGICFLKQAEENKIRRLNAMEALQRILTQTIRKRLSAQELDLLLGHLDKLVREIPIFELENRPEPAAVNLSYETMHRAAEEAGL